MQPTRATLSAPSHSFAPSPKYLQAEIWTTGQVAQFLSVAPRTVSKWCDSGEMLCYRIPGSTDRRIPRSSVLEFTRKHKMPQSEKLLNALGWLRLAVGVSDNSSRLLPQGCVGLQHLFDLGWKMDGVTPGCVLFDMAGLQTYTAIAAVQSIRKRYGSFYRLCCLLYDGSTLTRKELLELGFDEVVVASACNMAAFEELLRPRLLTTKESTNGREAPPS